ncbi:hypothetical protein ONZ45_g1245 [Pleurotus djamor]|nr:hypothetical protein ONZ45_g1245 [Pleurotus djamor]
MRAFCFSPGIFAIQILLFSSVFGEASENTKSMITPSPGVASSKSKLIAATWYAGWHADVFPLDSMPWEKYTMATETAQDGSLDLSMSNPSVLPEFVSMAKANDVLPLVSIGGWTGSRFFSTSVGSAQNRTRFVKTVVDFVKKYDLGGIDFDWEFPGRQGIGCNVVSPDDTSNFLEFLQELREDAFGRSLILTAAVSITPFASDVSAFSEVLDYIAIMNYDVWWMSSATIGPNAPLRDSCAAPQNQHGSAESALASWVNAGFPAEQIMLGVASYGHSFSVSPEDALTATGDVEVYPKYNGTKQGDPWEGPGGFDVCGNYAGPGGTYNFWAIIDAGLLKADGSPQDVVPYRFDNCSQTAYVYDKQKEVMISFDDPPSFAAKGTFIKERALAGFAVWEAAGDSRDSVLLDSIRKSAGF